MSIKRSLEDVNAVFCQGRDFASFSLKNPNVVYKII